MGATAVSIAGFLKTNVLINRINFVVGKYKVYPSAYQKDIADAFNSGAVKVNNGGPGTPGAGAAYDSDFDILDLLPGFNIADVRDQANLIHESTHIHLDIQNTGLVSVSDGEAVSYLAEAVFLEAAKEPPLSSDPIRLLSHTIAKKILAGTYIVSSADGAALTTSAGTTPHYLKKKPYTSNGFSRNFIQNIARSLP